MNDKTQGKQLFSPDISMDESFPTAFITGIGGQDGQETKKILEGLKYRVFGTKRINGLSYLIVIKPGCQEKIIAPINLLDFNEVSSYLSTINPTEIYHLAGVHSGSNEMVGLESTHKQQMFDVHVTYTRNLLQWIEGRADAKIVCALTSQMYQPGNSDSKISSKSELNPKNWYGETKAMAFELIKNAQNWGLLAYGAILFNHSSLFSKPGFLLYDLVKQIKLFDPINRPFVEVENEFSRLDISNANDICKGIKRLIDLNAPVNSTLGRGELISIHEILKQYFQEFEQLDVEIKSRSQITRPSLYADLQEINSKIGNWTAEKTTSQTLREMLQSNNSAWV